MSILFPILLLILFLLFFSTISAKFNFTQFKKLDDVQNVPECSAEINYFGTRNVSLDGEDCMVWREAHQIMAENFVGFWLYFFPDEFTDHNYCRNVRLDAYGQYYAMTNASMHLWLFESDEWRNGPWCYVRKEKRKGLWPDYKLVDSRGNVNSAGIMPSNETRKSKDFKPRKIDFEPQSCFCLKKIRRN